MLKKILVPITVLVLLYSCNEKFDHLEFEKQVAYEVFPDLIDSLHRDVRVAPPYLPPLYNEREKLIGFDTIAAEKNWEDYEERKLKYYNDSVKLVLAIADSTFLLNQDDKKAFLEFYKNEKIELDSTDINSKYKVKLDSLKADNKIEFKYMSDFPKGPQFWRNKNEYNFFLNAATGFSRIQFDKTKRYGILISNYTMGSLNGYGVRIFIKKVNNRWVIDKIVTTTIS